MLLVLVRSCSLFDMLFVCTFTSCLLCAFCLTDAVLVLRFDVVCLLCDVALLARCAFSAPCRCLILASVWRCLLLTDSCSAVGVGGQFRANAPYFQTVPPFAWFLGDSVIMSRSIPPHLSFLGSDVGREFFCRLWRGSHCGSCFTKQQLSASMEGIFSDPAFRMFLKEIYVLWDMESHVGDLDTFSRRLESPVFLDSLDSSLSLEDRCSILCHFRLAMSKIVDAFYVVEEYHGSRFRRRRAGSDIDWKNAVLPLFTGGCTFFREIYRHPYFCSLISSIADEPHGSAGGVTGYTGETLLHFLVSVRASSEDDQVAVLRAIDAADRASQRPNDVLLSQDRVDEIGSAAYYFRKQFDIDKTAPWERFYSESAVFRFLLNSYRDGPLYSSNDADDIGAPRMS